MMGPPRGPWPRLRGLPPDRVGVPPEGAEGAKCLTDLEVCMYRSHVNKFHSAKKFKQNVRKTKAPNMKAAPMRGGIRL